MLAKNEAGKDLRYITPALHASAVRLDSLVPHPKNVRKHGGKNMEALKRSLDRFGQVRPIVLASDGKTILAGHATSLASKDLGRDFVAVVVSHLKPNSKEALAYVVADNRTTDLSEFDDNLQEVLEEFDDPLRLAAGFDERDTVAGFGAGDSDQDGEFPQTPEAPVTQPGDTWSLGKHRLICAHPTDRAAYQWLKESAGAGVAMVWTDPPEEKKITPVEGISDLFTTAFELAKEVCAPGARWYVFCPSGPDLAGFLGKLRALGLFRQLLLWVKDRGFRGGDFPAAHEVAAVGGGGPGEEVFEGSTKPPEASPGSDDSEAGEDARAELAAYGWAPGSRLSPPGRSETSVWFAEVGKTDKRCPTAKPVTLAYRALRLSTFPRDVVLDPFLRSGTLLLAAEETGRVCLALESDPALVDLAVARWQAYTGQEAIRRDGHGRKLPGLPAPEDAPSDPESVDEVPKAAAKKPKRR